MKYIVLIGDGMADYPQDALSGRTPLEAARIPNMREIAKLGQVGLAKTIPGSLAPASDVANLSILGYDPRKYYKGRGPLEAANMGIILKEGEVAFRCNLITESDGTLLDYSAGHIKTEEAKALIQLLDRKLGSKSVKFYPGIGYRHLVVVKENKDTPTAEELAQAECTPPHDVTGQRIEKNLPRGKAAQFLINLMEDSRAVLKDIDVNRVRIDLKENPGNMIWLWGQGTSYEMPKFADKYDVNGAVISAVDLINGIGRTIGFKVIKVPGATGYYDTNFQGKADYAVKYLKDGDFIYVHVEAPDEAGHNGDLRAKVGAIENFDKYVVGTVLEKFRKLKNWRLLVMPDHYTPIKAKTHTNEPVPFAICGKDIAPDRCDEFSEKAASESKLVFNEGHKLMDYLIKGLSP